MTRTTDTAVTTARYARTFSSTRRHILNPDHGTEKTLCGGQVRLTEVYVNDSGVEATAAPWMVRDLAPCARCERSAAKRGIVAG